MGNTIVYFALLNLFLHPLGRFWAITVGNVVAIGISYVLNRRWSFRIDDGSIGNARESVIFFAVNLVGWALAIFITELSNGIWGPLSRLEVNLASAAATALIVLPKFMLYRDVIFKKSLEESQLVGEREATLGA